MAAKKPLVLNGGQLQRLQSGDTLDPAGLFDAGSNLGSVSGLASNGITVHNGSAFTTVSLSAPAAGMTITNPDGIGGAPTFAFTAELADLLSIDVGLVTKDAAGNLTNRTIQGTTGTITVTNGNGVSGNPTITIASNPVLPGTGAVTVPTGTTGEQPGTPTAGMVRYNTTAAKFEFYENGAWVNYGTSNAVGTVTSVDVVLPDSLFSASSGAITTSGTITFTLDTQAANTVFAGPVNGAAAAPAFRALVSDDIPALAWSKITSGTPTTLTGYGITDGVVNTTQVIAGSGLTGGGALSSNVTISMPNVGTAVTGQFVKITTDDQGRVSATAAVGAADITTALGYTPVNKAGDTMANAANLVFSGGGTVTGLPMSAVNATDAASKAYVDNVVASGTTWRDPVRAPNLVGIVSTKPTATSIRTQWIKYGGTQAELWQEGANPSVTVSDGDILEYRPSDGGWYNIGTLTAGDRFTISGEHTTITIDASLHNIGIRHMDLIEYATGATDPTLEASWLLPHHDNNQAAMYTTELTTATVTNLLTGTTYTATVKVNGTGTTDNISVDGTTGMTIGTLLSEINSDLDAAFGAGNVVASIVAGHVHVTGINATDRIVLIDGATNALFAASHASFTDFHGGVIAGTTVLCSNILSQDNGRTGLFSGGADGEHAWIEIGGPTAINAGVGLAYDGNILNINLGAGIKELPSDQVGIDLYDATTGAIILTETGTTRSTGAAGQLHLLLDSTTLTQGASGLKVAAAGITATELNSSIAGAGLTGGSGTALSVVTDGSSLEITGDSLNVKAGGVTAAMLATAVAGAGLVNSGTALDINVGSGALEIQTDVLNIKNGGVSNAMLANSTVLLAGETGTGSVALGSTLTITGGAGIDTSVSGSTATITLNATLDDLSDVTITTAAAGNIIYRNAGNTAWVNGAPGATAGVQPYDSTLSALASLSGVTGMVVESGTDAFVTRVIQGTSGRTTVTNGDGVAGDPTIDLASGVVTPGTYSSVTVDTYGRVTAGSAVEASTQVAMTNANAGSLVIGTPVYVSVGGSVDKADSGATSTTKVIGLVADTAIATTASGNIAVAGILTATTGQWDAVVTGGSGGLVGGSTYYLEPGTAGKLTTIAPSGAGEYIAPVGIALSSTKLKIQIDPTIQL